MFSLERKGGHESSLKLTVWCLQRYCLGRPNLPRVRPAGDGGGGGGGSGATRNPSGINPDPNESQCEEPDAERRLMCVNPGVVRVSLILLWVCS
jgi:hypothetical protein